MPGQSWVGEFSKFDRVTRARIENARGGCVEKFFEKGVTPWLPARISTHDPAQ